MAKQSTILRMFGTVVFCDVSDAVGAGAPGENTWILKAIMDGAPELTSYLFLCYLQVAKEAIQHEIGDELSVMVGGKLDKIYNRPVAFTGTVHTKIDNHENFGTTVILQHQGIHLIVTEFPGPGMSPWEFTDLGLSLWNADIVVVKNLFPFRFKFLLYNRKTVDVVSAGTTDINVHALKYDSIPRPIYPLDEDVDEWRIQPQQTVSSTID